MVLSVTPPHFPLVVEERWKRFDRKKLEVRRNFNDSDPRFRECLANYYAMIENLDWNIGRLLDEIESAQGFRGNTLVVYFSDHGDFMGSHDRESRKEHPFEESIRIPSIFYWPGEIRPLAGVEDLFSLVDLLPTTLGLIGVEVPPHVQGTDFSPRLRGQEFRARESVLTEMVNNPRWNLDFLDWRAIVTEEWKYAHYETGEELLFNLLEDPYELTNLVGVRSEKRDEMRGRLLALLRETREPYYDVLMEYGVRQKTPDRDVSVDRRWNGI